MSIIKYCIFDCDGLLLDTEDIYTIATQQILDQYGKEFTYHVKHQMMGLKAEEAAKILISSYQIPLTPQEYLKERNRIHYELFPTCKLLPGVAKLIRHLKFNKIPIGVATSSHRNAFNLKISNHKELFALFDTIITAEDVKHGKPAPDSYLLAAKNLGMKKGEESQCLIFEDAPLGVKAGLAAGMKVVWVPDSNMKKDMFIGENVTVLKSLEDFNPADWNLPPFQAMAEKKKLRLAGVETGGMSILVSIAEDHPTNIVSVFKVDNDRDDKDAPKVVLPPVLKYLKEQKVDAIGIGSFGPVDLNPKSPTYGYITSTPKASWRNYNLLSHFKDLGVPVDISTDVNVCAVGELAYGNHGNITSCCYITVGTGIGVGVVVDGKPVTGLLHPEGGHFKPPRFPGDDFVGDCPYHKDCTEGLAAAGAIAKRAKCDVRNLQSIPDDHKVWEYEAFYIAHLCSVLTTIVSPQVIVLGGGVLKRALLFPKIRRYFKELLNEYLVHPKLLDHIDSYIVPSPFNTDKTTSGAVGSLELGLQAWKKSKTSKL